MNEELQKAITELFQSAISAKDFLVGELPEYINQLLMWHAISSFMAFSISLAILCGSIYSACKAKSIMNRIHGNPHEDQERARIAMENKEPWCFYNGDVASKVTSLEYDRIMRRSIETIDYFPFAAVVGMVFVGSFAVTVNSTDWLKIWIAPKVWLVEYVASLVK